MTERSDHAVAGSEALPDPGVRFWWRSLCVLAVLNVCLWVSIWLLGPVAGDYSAWHLSLSGVYVLVCAYRSVLPRVDLERTVIVDSRLSSIFLGRTAATVAEVCFGIQLGVLVHQLGEDAGLPAVQAAAFAIPLFTAVAQVFCWHSIITLNHATQAVESSLWAAGFAWMAALLLVVAWYSSGPVHAVAVAGIVVAMVFVSYVIAVDVPMYLRRYRHGKATGQRYLGLAEGVRDVWRRRERRLSWTGWKDDARWLTPYFSAGAWISMALVFAPHP